MRLARHLTVLRAWCKQCLPRRGKPDVLRPGIVGIQGSMIIRPRPCMRSSTSLLSCTPPPHTHTASFSIATAPAPRHCKVRERVRGRGAQGGLQAPSFEAGRPPCWQPCGRGGRRQRNLEGTASCSCGRQGREGEIETRGDDVTPPTRGGD